MDKKSILKLGFVLLFIFVWVLPGNTSETKSIKIGALLPLSGAYGSAGVDPKKAIELLVEDLNSKGGINGRHLELIIKDTQSSSAAAVSQFQSLVEDEALVAMAGPIATVEMSSIKPVAREEKLPVFAVSSSPGSVNLPEAEYVWRCWVNDGLGMEAAFKIMAEKMGIKKVALLYQADAFGEGIKKAAEANSAKYGLELVKPESFLKTDTDMSVQLAKFRRAGAQLVVCGGHGGTSGYIAKSCGTIGWEVALWAGNPAANPDTIRVGGQAAEGFWITSNFIPGAPMPGVQMQFSKKWQKLTGKPMTFLGILGASAIQVLIAAVEKAAAGEITRQTISETMQNMVVDTAGGRFYYTPTSHEGGTIDSLANARVKDGKWVLWDPKPIKDRSDW